MQTTLFLQVLFAYLAAAQSRMHEDVSQVEDISSGFRQSEL